MFVQSLMPNRKLKCYLRYKVAPNVNKGKAKVLHNFTLLCIPFDFLSKWYLIWYFLCIYCLQKICIPASTVY